MKEKRCHLSFNPSPKPRKMPLQ